MTIFDINLFGLHIAPTYYGLMYVLGFVFGYLIIKKRNILDKSSKNNSFLNIKLLDDLFLYIFLGVLLGGRLGYVVFYNFDYYLNNIFGIIKIWEGGMSFHGGVIGVIIAMIVFSKKNNKSFYRLADEITSVLPIGLGFGRIGNFLNKELLGFSNYYGPLSVDGIFPSPLVESLLEGLVLFIILNLVYKKKQFDGQIASLFLILYGIFRIIVEIFFREPDFNIGYIFGFLTMGEILSLPMIIFGSLFYIKLKKNKNKI